MSYETQYPESLLPTNTQDFAVMRQMLKAQRKKLAQQIVVDGGIDFRHSVMQKALKARLDDMRKYLQHNYGAV